MKNKKILLLLLLIFLLGFFLRFWKIEENFIFSAEQGVEILEIKNFIINREIPLYGPPASHSWFRFGPFYYWLMMPVMVLFNFNPIGGAYLGVLAGSLMVFLNFFFVAKIFNQKIALISSFLMVISPFLIEFSRSARFYFLVAMPFYLLLWSAYKFWQGEGRYLFWLGLSLGIIFNFHLSPLIITPAIFLILSVKRKSLRLKNIGQGFLGILIPSFAFLVYDFTHGLSMSTKMLAWIPYRVAGFLGFYPKNNFTLDVLKESLQIFINFFSETFIIGQKNLVILITIVMIAFLVFNFKKALQSKKKEDFGWFFLFWTLIFGLFGLFVHGSSPKQYFIIICPVLILIFSLFLEKLWRSVGKIVVVGILLILTLFNLRYFFSSSGFYGHCQSFLCLKNQKEIIKKIVDDAQGKNFELRRVGEFDYYQGQYAQNYQYLAWWLGNQPVEGAKLRYTIYEQTERFPSEVKEKEKKLKVGSVYILKEND
jgi:4-amino-4-deoxy-L-arabinose transferase-like glycosyltransferase